MLARKSLSKKKILLLGGTLALVWGIIGVVVYRNFASKNAPLPSVPIVLPGEPIASVYPVAGAGQRAGLEILRDERLTSLKIFCDVPLEVTALGRENPFELINP